MFRGPLLPLISSSKSCNHRFKFPTENFQGREVRPVRPLTSPLYYSTLLQLPTFDRHLILPTLIQIPTIHSFSHQFIITSQIQLVPTILPSFYSFVEILEDFHFKSLVVTRHESTNANQISNISFSTDQITEERCVFSCFWPRRALSRPQQPTHSPSSHQIRRSMENRLMLLGSPSTLAPVALPPTAHQTMRTNVPRFREPSSLAD